MDLKDKKLWLELYEVAGRIQKLEPWKYLWDTDLLMYGSEELKDIFYCSVMGRGGVHKAVAVYQGNQINMFLDLAENDYPSNMLLNYQECLMCNFVGRQETLPANRALIKELGLSFRGTWISFECFEKGYEPSPINIEQVKVMIHTLKNFYMMLKAYIDKQIEVNFDDNEVIARHYDKDKKVYLNYPNQLMVPDQNYGVISFNEKFEEAVNKLPKTDSELEVEFLNYLPVRIKSNREADGRFYYPRVSLLADRTSGIMLSCDLLNKNDYKNELEYIMEALDPLMKHIFENGRPKRIYVRDEESKMCLKELEEKAKIKITVRPKLKVIDNFYNNLANRNFSM